MSLLGYYDLIMTISHSYYRIYEQYFVYSSQNVQATKLTIWKWSIRPVQFVILSQQQIQHEGWKEKHTNGERKSLERKEKS